MKILSPRRTALIALLVAVCGGAYYGYAWLERGGADAKPAAKAAKPGKPATPVLVARASARDVPVIINTIGTMQARATVSIRSRVDGQILETAFTEGALINKGEPLFRIDPRPFEAKLREAQANLARDQAALDKAKTDFERYKSLSGKGFTSQQKYEEARAAMNGLTATIRADQASVDLAKLDLEFTTIRAPITGRTGSVLVNAGNLIKANDQQPLVVINETDPILASFSVPERHLVEIKQRLNGGALPVAATIPDSNREPIRGQIVFINNAVDTQTGTVQLKAAFDNPDGLLTPGQFIRVVIEMSSIRSAVVVPERSLQNGQKGSYIFTVSDEMTAIPVPVTPGPTVDGFTVVGDALKVGDIVVTDGQLRLFKGAKVSFKEKDAAPGKPKDDKPKDGKDKMKAPAKPDAPAESGPKTSNMAPAAVTASSDDTGSASHRDAPAKTVQ